jgi:hypothetical protein
MKKKISNNYFITFSLDYKIHKRVKWVLQAIYGTPKYFEWPGIFYGEISVKIQDLFWQKWIKKVW